MSKATPELDQFIPRTGHSWGEWRLSTTEPISLDYGNYEIALDRIFRASDTYRECPLLVSWIKHLNDKGWGKESMGDFVDAVLTIGRFGYIHKGKHVHVWPGCASECGYGVGRVQWNDVKRWNFSAGKV
jgi:hypothetical protein